MPDQPEPDTVESGAVTMVAVQETSGPTSPAPSTSGDDTFLSIEELKALSYEDLQKLCSDNQLNPPPEANNEQDLLDWLLSEFGVDV